jgi:type IV secretory pathway VirB10-like protein
MRRRAVLGAIGACAVVLSATACSSDSDSDAAPNGSLPEAAVDPTTGPTDATATRAPAPTDGSTQNSSPATESPTAPTNAVPEILQFTAPLVGGGTFDGAADAGIPTVFWFWAPT